MRMGETAFLGLMVLLCLLLVLRPMVYRLTMPPAALLGADGSPATGDGPALTGPDAAGDTVVDLADAIAPLPRSAIARVAALVDTHPQESVAVLRDWVLTEQEA